MGARHSCRFSVNHSLVCAGGQTFWTVKRRKRRAPVPRSHRFNCIVPIGERNAKSRFDQVREVVTLTFGSSVTTQ
jgi:hypothetical protein